MAGRQGEFLLPYAPPMTLAKPSPQCAIDTLQTLWVECARLIPDRKCKRSSPPCLTYNLPCAGKLPNNATIAICYSKYESDALITQGVEVRGWPSNIPLANPPTLSTLDNPRTLRNALEAGHCRRVGTI